MDLETIENIDEVLVHIGGSPTVKQLNNDTILVAGPAVLFSNDGSQKDLDGQYFSKDTNFGYSTENNLVPTLNHRFPIVTDNKKANALLANLRGATFKNPMKLSREDWGLMATHILDLKDDFERWVSTMIKMGAFKLSTGALGHMVKVSDNGHLDEWHIGEVAYTPTPAEPRLRAVMPLKALSEIVFHLSKEENNMKFDQETEVAEVIIADNELTQAQVKKLRKQWEEERQRERELEDTKRQLEAAKATNATLQEQLEAKNTDLTPVGSSKLHNLIFDPTKHGSRGDFNKWARAYATTETSYHFELEDAFGDDKGVIEAYQEMDARKFWKAYKADQNMNLTTGASNVPVPLYQTIVEKRDEMAFYPAFGIPDFGGVGTDLRVPKQNDDTPEFSESTEEAAADRNAPVVGEQNLSLKMYRRRIPYTAELLRDHTTNLLAYASSWVGRGWALTHNSVLISELTSTATPATADAVAAISKDDILRVMGTIKSGWFRGSGFIMHRSILWGHVRSIVGDDFLFPSADRNAGQGVLPDDGTIQSMPVYQSEKPDAAPAANANTMFFFNGLALGMRQPGGMTVLRDPYSQAANGILNFHYAFSLAYGVIQAEGAVRLVHPAS